MYEIFLKLLDKKGVRTSDVSKETGITASTFTDWKNGRSNPKLEKLQKIADYFGVTIEYLMTGNEPEKDFDPKLTSKDERDIIKKVDDILSQLNSGEALMFDGEPMNEETMELLRASLENSVKMAKITAKKKFTPKKYRK